MGSPGSRAAGRGPTVDRQVPPTLDDVVGLVLTAGNLRVLPFEAPEMVAQIRERRRRGRRLLAPAGRELAPEPCSELDPAGVVEEIPGLACRRRLLHPRVLPPGMTWPGALGA